jgi:hypothetical protein
VAGAASNSHPRPLWPITASPRKILMLSVRKPISTISTCSAAIARRNSPERAGQQHDVVDVPDVLDSPARCLGCQAKRDSRQ